MKDAAKVITVRQIIKISQPGMDQNKTESSTVIIAEPLIEFHKIILLNTTYAQKFNIFPGKLL